MKLRLKVWGWLLLALLVGALCLALPKQTWDFGLIHEIGIAFVVAAIIGGTIEFTLATAIARDVFEATLGHILRPEFRAEIARIIGYEFLCERHVLLVDVKLISNNVVEVTSSIERTSRNITAYPKNQCGYA